MSQFLINAASVLRKMSHRDETLELLKNQTWLYVDVKNKDEKYLFKDDGEVEIDNKETVTKYKWEFISASNKLQISNPEGFSLFILYIDKSVVILQTNAEKPEFSFLVNLKYLQKKEVESYIHNAVAKQMNLSLMHVTDGFDMEIHRRHAEDAIGSKGQEVTRDLKRLPDGMYKSSSSSFIYEVQDSIIVRKNLFFKITLAGGIAAGLYTENKVAFVSAGDTILVDEKPLADGKYFTGDGWFIYANGKVTHAGTLKKFKTPQGTLIIEQNDAKPAAGDVAYLEGGKPFEGEVSAGLFKKIKVSGGKIV